MIILVNTMWLVALFLVFKEINQFRKIAVEMKSALVLIWITFIRETKLYFSLNPRSLYSNILAVYVGL